MQLARRRLEQLVHVLPESIKQRKLHLHILLEQLNLARGHRLAFRYDDPEAVVVWFLGTLMHAFVFTPGCIRSRV